MYKEKHALIIILEDIRSALNVGAIFRTCDAVGAAKLVLTGITPCPPHAKIPKTALGAVEHVSWEYIADTKAAIDRFAAEAELIAVELTPEAKVIYKYSFKKPTALIFGNEISGVSPYALSKAKAVVQIPMFGIKESLNVATTVGIAAYEVVRQWNF
jgi:tRNA G18 (ribose-2'-O)-methylase SpoU